MMNNCLRGDTILCDAPSIHRAKGHVLDRSFDIVAVFDSATGPAFAIEAVDALHRVDQSHHRATHPGESLFEHMFRKSSLVLSEGFSGVFINRLGYFTEIVDHSSAASVDRHLYRNKLSNLSIN